MKGRIRWTEATRKPWMLPRLPQTVRERSFDMQPIRCLPPHCSEFNLFQNELEPGDLSLFYRLRHEWSEIANRTSIVIKSADKFACPARRLSKCLTTRATPADRRHHRLRERIRRAGIHSVISKHLGKRLRRSAKTLASQRAGR